jgi:hypothetical protein
LTEIYIKGPVLSPGMIGRPEWGMTDRPLTAQEIQKAAYYFLPGTPVIDKQHDFKKQAEVVESYIAAETTEFNNKEYPPGTWFVTSKVTDPKLQKEIQNRKLTGYSIGALPNKYREAFMEKGLFKDVEEGEWFPIAVSMVDMPFYPEMIFKIFNHDDIIKKNVEKGAKNMKDDNGMLTVVEKLLDMVSIKKEAPENKEDTTKEEEDSNIPDQLDKIFKILETLDERITTLEKKEKEENEPGEPEKKDEEIKKSIDNQKEEANTIKNTKIEDKSITKSIEIDNAQLENTNPFGVCIGCDATGRNKKYLQTKYEEN